VHPHKFADGLFDFSHPRATVPTGGKVFPNLSGTMRRQLAIGELE
jgi:hypothetical protein